MKLKKENNRTTHYLKWTEGLKIMKENDVTSDEVKKQKRRNSYKRTAKTFIRHHATLDDLNEIEKMIEDKKLGKKV